VLDNWIWIRKVKKFRIRRISLYDTSSSTFFPSEYLLIHLAHIYRTYIGARGASVNENFLFCLFPLHSPPPNIYPHLDSLSLSLSLQYIDVIKNLESCTYVGVKLRTERCRDINSFLYKKSFSPHMVSNHLFSSVMDP
jgi:hypothetical protein